LLLTLACLPLVVGQRQSAQSVGGAELALAFSVGRRIGSRERSWIVVAVLGCFYFIQPPPTDPPERIRNKGPRNHRLPPGSAALTLPVGSSLAGSRRLTFFSSLFLLPLSSNGSEGESALVIIGVCVRPLRHSTKQKQTQKREITHSLLALRARLPGEADTTLAAGASSADSPARRGGTLMPRGQGSPRLPAGQPLAGHPKGRAPLAPLPGGHGRASFRVLLAGLDRPIVR
jgi:hypothetical protein